MFAARERRIWDSGRGFESYEHHILRGKVRLKKLLEWLEEDRGAGNADFRLTRERWKADVLPRIYRQRPTVIRLPACLMEALELKSKEVTIEEGDVIRHIETGRIIA